MHQTTLHIRTAILACLLFPAIAQAADDVLFVKSPHTSLSKTRKLLDAADLRLMLPRGYVIETETETTLGKRGSVVEVRSYNKQTQRGVARRDRLEIAIVPGLQQGYEFALYRSPNDRVLYDIKDGLKKIADRAQTRGGSAEPELGYEMFRLGHMDASRALSLLKALGYTTIEFTASSSSKGGEEIFNLSKGSGNKLPWIVKVMNASKTSLLETSGSFKTRKSSSSSKGGIQGAPQLGGAHLFGATTDAPEERLLMVYDRNEPEELEKLVNLLQSYIDVAAQQIVIEALVIEINKSDLQDLGVEFFASKDHASSSFGPPTTGSKAQGTFNFARNGFTDFADFNASVEALAETGNAEVLSSPSVLVLNDRQARIQVGRQIPVSRTTATNNAALKGIEYFPIGIVLNLRPRINRDKTEVAMQIETIISSISSESAARLEESTNDVTFSPIVDNRLVESYVRVADGTPFIIGGLLSTEEQSTRIGIPMLMQVPLLGRLFSREKIEHLRREVIVVITPHIVPLKARNFSYLIPKDSDIFDRFDFHLFRNGYRVRDDEVWDLKFIQESPVLQGLIARVRRHASEDVMLQRKAPFSTLLAGNIPGEDVLVRRMLSDIVSKLDYAKEIDTEKLFFFEKTEADNLVDRDLPSVIERIKSGADRAVMISYDAQPKPEAGRPFSYPFAAVTDTTVPAQEEAYAAFLRAANPVDEEDRPLQWTIILRDRQDVAHLHRALILKRLLELNDKLPLTLEAFQPGLQIVFPSREDMAGRYHLIDGEVAQLFYETSSSQYYPAFERIFNRRTREIEQELGGRK
jgi:Flp pilus assembly secretin CpaC